MTTIELRDYLRDMCVKALNEGNNVTGVLACDTSTMLDMFIQKKKSRHIPQTIRHGIEVAYVNNGGNWNNQANQVLMVSMYTNLRLKYNALLMEEESTDATS